MIGKIFIEREKLALETRKKEEVRDVVDVMEAALKFYPLSEIGKEKTAEDCYNKMRKYAGKCGGCLMPEETVEFICDYLGIKKLTSDDISNILELLSILTFEKICS